MFLTFNGFEYHKKICEYNLLHGGRSKRRSSVSVAKREALLKYGACKSVILRAEMRSCAKKKLNHKI